MTHQTDNSPQNSCVNSIVQQLLEDGKDGIAAALQELLNQAMIIERSNALQAQPYERTPDRLGQANGFKNKNYKTRVGSLKLNIPQVRGNLEFYPSVLEKGQRSEQALVLAMAEMYVQGVSTRNVSSILQETCGLEISSTQVSNATAHLDVTLNEWRNRPLTSMRYLILDARYEKVRHGGHIVDCAVLIAIGVGLDGKRSVLGVSVALSEAEVHWRQFLTSLQERGLQGVELIVSDDHPGLRNARKACWPTVPWQRCQFHLQQNAQAYVPRLDMRSQVAADIRSIFDSPEKAEADERLKIIVKKYATIAPSLAAWMEINIPEGLTVFLLPIEHRRKMRTSNSLERQNQEIKRRTRVIRIFPNEKSLLRLVTALLMETSDNWETNKIYLTMKSNNLKS